MELLLVAIVALAVAFDVSNGFHDSSNVIAALVATGAARPVTAVALSATFNLLGPIIGGTAVADTVGGIVALDPRRTLEVLTAALVAGLTWNLLTWWRGLPSSSSHALVGGLVGAGLVTAGPGAVMWGGFRGPRPVGVAGVLVGLAISPLLGAVAGLTLSGLARRGLRRADRRVNKPIRRAEWVTASALAFSHGTNDAQKMMGVITLGLLSVGAIANFSVPLWVKVLCASAMATGSALGGWRVVRTIGRGIYRIRPLDGLVSQTSSTVVIGAAAVLGAPVSTTHVVASSIVGVGAQRKRRHVHWPVVREILLAWVVTLPVCAAVGALAAMIGRAAL